MRADQGLAIRRIATLFRGGTCAGMSDGELIARFLERRGADAEAAFAILVERHAAMVRRVCRGVLADRNDVDDAFQGAFLALAQHARQIRNRDSAASWLHGAALRISVGIKSAQARRRAREHHAATLRVVSEIPHDTAHDDLGAILHEEISRLPPRFRAAVCLCDIEGLSLAEAANELGCAVGTVKSRVARGRRRLRDRLARRGIAPGLALSVGLRASGMREVAIIPASLIETTARLAVVGLAGRGSAGLWATRSSLLMRLRLMTIGLAAAGVLAGGAALFGQKDGGGAKQARTPATETIIKEITVVYNVASIVGAPEAGRLVAPPPAVGALDDPADRVFVHSYLDLAKKTAVEPPPAQVGGAFAAAGPAATINMEPLIELIASSVAPGTWKGRDAQGKRGEGFEGLGEMTPSADGRFLRVKQSLQAHARIETLLSQLRRVVEVRGSNSGLTQGEHLFRPAALAEMQQAQAARRKAVGYPSMPGVDAAKPPATEERPIPPPNAAKKAAAGSPEQRVLDNERRLRSVEEKLDRILKALESADPPPKVRDPARQSNKPPVP